ncbi:Crp/Fnr family transcriptional regulator [Streptomyces sp. NPDC048172]|uniref:Crp/Fnr family transcriptional regulator n=1 Tax=Streptomyces sp. NPDC048172 TaxID=3365505 RepID=UPI0037188A21
MPPNTESGPVRGETPGASFSPEHWSLLSEGSSLRPWKRGEPLMRQGERAHEVILIAEGRGKITTVTGNGHTRLLTIRKAGELVGELGCLDGGSRSATVTAMCPTRGYVIPGTRFATLLGNDGELALAVMRSVCRKLRHSDSHRASMGAGLPCLERVAQVLAEHSVEHGETVAGRPRTRLVRLTQQEIAEASGVARETVVRTLRKLAGKEFVERRRGAVLVRDPAALLTWLSER